MMELVVNSQNLNRSSLDWANIGFTRYVKKSSYSSNFKVFKFYFPLPRSPLLQAWLRIISRQYIIIVSNHIISA